MRLREGKKPITDIYSLRIYNTELVKFQLVVEQLARDAAKVLYVNERMKYLLPSDMYLSGEGILKWLKKRVIPRKCAFHRRS